MTKSDDDRVQLWGRTKDGEWKFVRFGARAAMLILAGGFDATGKFDRREIRQDQPIDAAGLTRQIWERAQQLADQDGNSLEPHELDLMKNPDGDVHPLWYPRRNMTRPANNPYLGMAVTQLSEEGWRLK